jgi:CBS domain-containing protein
MAIVGPLTSLILGVVFTLLTGVGIGSLGTSVNDPAEIAAQLGPVTTLLIWLGPVNILLAVFNMIPGFPLDGGRVLRAIFWAITDNLKRATRWASWVGQAIAWILIINGIAMVFGVEVPFFGTGIANGLWLAFIGWFLNNAALQSYQQIVIQDVLKGVAVRRMMHSDPPTAKRGLTVNELVHDYIMKSDDHAFPVVEGDQKLVGVVTLEDVRAVPQHQWEAKHIDEIMTPDEELVCVTPDEDASKAFDKLSRRDVRQLPVIENNKLVGVLRRSDVVKWLQFQSESDIEEEPTFA